MSFPRTMDCANHLNNMILSRHNSLVILIAVLGLSAVLMLGWHNSNKLESCDGDGVNRQKCFAEQIEMALSAKGIDAAFDTLIVFSKKDTNFATACHGNVHDLGKVAYKRFALGEKIEYTRKMSYCGYGFFHGFAEELFVETGNLDKAIAFCKSLDGNLRGSASGGTTACFHGMGHGAVDGSDPNAWGDPTKMIQSAMELCKQLPKEHSAEYVCNAGAYNSLEILSTDEKYRLKALAEDPYAFCNSQPRTRRDACYVNMIPAVLRITKDDVREATRYILPRITYPNDLTIDDDFRVDAMVILGLFHEFIRLSFGHPEAIAKGIALCHEFSSDRLRLACVAGLSGGHMKYDTPESAYENWVVFCGSSLLREDEKQACFQYVLSKIHLWYDDARAKTICQSVPEQYQSYCKIRS